MCPIRIASVMRQLDKKPGSKATEIAIEMMKGNSKIGDPAQDAPKTEVDQKVVELQKCLNIDNVYKLARRRTSSQLRNVNEKLLSQTNDLFY